MINIKTTLWGVLDKLTPFGFFITNASIFGIAFLLITPPFQTPDEPVHFYRAYQISQGNLVIDQEGRNAGGELPVSLAKTVIYTTIGHSLEFHPDRQYHLGLTRKALSFKEESSNKTFYDLSATSYYSVISYLPQSIGILIARILHLSPLLMMYFGRLASLVAWVLLLGLSIKAMPYKKWAMAAVGLLPMAIFQSISLSTDVMTLGLTALALALILKYQHLNKRLTSKQYLVLLITLTGLLLSKQAMFIFLPLVLLLPKKILQNTVLIKKNYGRWLLFALPLLIFLVWMYIASHIKLLPGGAFSPMPAEQIKFIFTHPLGYLSVLWKTYFFTPSDGVARSVIGTFGWVDAPLSEFWATLGYITLTFLFIVNTAKMKKALNKYQKGLILVVLVAYLLLVTTALYVYYDPLKYKIIIGLQGRYFIPLIFLLIPLLRSDWLQAKRLHYRLIATSLPFILLTASSITLFYRYYVHY